MFKGERTIPVNIKLSLHYSVRRCKMRKSIIIIFFTIVVCGILLAQEDTTTIKIWDFSPTTKIATTTYNWQLSLTSNKTDLNFFPHVSEQSAEYTINVEKIIPGDIPAQYIGNIVLRKTGTNVETLDLAVGYLGYSPSLNETIQLGRVVFLTGPLIFRGTRRGEGQYDSLFPLNLLFNIPYQFRENTYFFYRCTTYFRDGTPAPKKHPSDQYLYSFTWTNEYVNNTLTLSNEIVNEPSGFTYDWNGLPQSVNSSTTLNLGLQATNISASPQDEPYNLTNKIKGESENGNIWYSNEVTIYLNVPKLPTVDKNFTTANATKTYNWTLEKVADSSHLEFTYPFDQEKQVVFNISATKIDPGEFNISLCGSITIENTHQRTALNIKSVVDKVLKEEELVHQEELFSGDQSLEPGALWEIPFNITFTTPYEINDLTNYLAVQVEYFDDPASEEVEIDGTTNFINDYLTVTDGITVPEGFNWCWNYPEEGWQTTSSNTFDISFNISLITPVPPEMYGGHKVTNVANGISDDINLSSSFEIFIDVIKPATETVQTVFLTYSPGYYKNHQSVTTSLLPINLCGTNVNSWNTAYSILSNPSAKEAWNSFRCHFLTLLLNRKFNDTLQFALYNDLNRSGEPFEWYPVDQIIAVAQTYTSSTARQTLLTMKDVCDAINNNQTTKVLWRINGGQDLMVSPLPATTNFRIYPNPFTSKAVIQFGTEMKEPVRVSIYDLTGKKVCELSGKGTSLIWNGTDNYGNRLSKGIYILKVENMNIKEKVIITH